MMRIFRGSAREAGKLPWLPCIHYARHIAVPRGIAAFPPSRVQDETPQAPVKAVPISSAKSSRRCTVQVLAIA